MLAEMVKKPRSGAVFFYAGGLLMPIPGAVTEACVSTY